MDFYANNSTICDVPRYMVYALQEEASKNEHWAEQPPIYLATVASRRTFNRNIFRPLLHLHGFTIKGHTHSVKAIINVHRDAGNTAGHRRAEKETNVTNIVVVKILSKRSVSIWVVNSILDEGLLSRFLANGGGGTGFERAGTNSVDANAVLSAMLPIMKLPRFLTLRQNSTFLPMY